jgi:nitrite reductase (NO-forming)
MDEQGQVPRATGWAIAFIAAAAVVPMVIAVGGVVLVAGPSDSAMSTDLTGETITLEVELGDLYVEPSSVDVPPGTELVVTVMNVGEMAHDLKLAGTTGTALLDPGQTQEVSLGVVSETTQAWCTVPGHKEASSARA